MTAEQRTDGGVSRGLILAACIVGMLAVANLQYAWTLFTTPLMEDLGTSLARIQVAFSIFVIAQTALFPINAYLIDRFSPRIVITIASVFVTAGWVGAGYAGMSKSLPTLYVAYGLGGIGAGAVYAASIGAAMKWFPDHRGLCVGVVAGAYGFGAALTVLPIEHMIRAGHYRSAFFTWGLIQGIVVLIAAQFLKMPADDWVPAGWGEIKLKLKTKVQQSKRNYRPAEMLKSRSFYILYLMMTLVTFSGLMVTVQVVPIGERYGYDKYLVLGGATILGVTLLLNNVLNGIARPFFGWVSDYLGRYDTMGIAFIMGAVAITGFTLLVGHLAWFVILCGLTFFAWGDIYSLFPAAIADIFGNKHATTNYGIQYTAKGVGSIFAGPCAALLMAKYDSWLPVFWLAVACNVTAAGLAVLWLKPLIARLMREQVSEEAQGTPAEPAGEQAASVIGVTTK
jgi:MFS transporter, OFA family, oxalate/formate antiporter